MADKRRKPWQFLLCFVSVPPFLCVITVSSVCSVSSNSAGSVSSDLLELLQMMDQVTGHLMDDPIDR
jgi:hypothetical protein